MIDERNLIKNFENRIDTFLKQHPDQKDCVEVQRQRELIQLIEAEAKKQELKRQEHMLSLESRLISDENLKDRASECCLSEDEFRRFCEMIDAEPTAYDIDSVVGRLEECISDTSNTITGIAAEWAYKGAIEIVKAGGK